MYLRLAMSQNGHPPKNLHEIKCSKALVYVYRELLTNRVPREKKKKSYVLSILCRDNVSLCSP